MGDARTLAVVRKPKVARAPPSRLFRQAADRCSVLGRRVQPALRVGAANDPLELEAERTAERVVAMAAPSPAPPPDDEPRSPNEAQARRSIDQESQPNTDTFETAPPIPEDHQDPNVPKTEDVDTAGLKQDEFGEIETGEPTPPDAQTLQPAMDGDAVGAEGGAAPPDVAQRVSQPGTGRPLPASVRAFMEPRFGVGFQDVRIHDGSDDRRTADRIGARAFTHRHHIWLGQGETVEDRRLLAHELTHVVQQTRRPALGAGPAARSADKDEDRAQRSPEPQIRRGWLRNKAEKYAREVPGYFTIEVILGKSPITGEEIPRTAENVCGAFLSLLPGGHAIFEKLQETRALTDAFEWISRRLSELNITWSRVKGCISDFLDAMPTLRPIRAAKRIFGPLVRDVITFATDIGKKVLEFIIHGALRLAGSWGEKVWGVILQAREAISLIIDDPLGFAKNLIRSLVGGFQKFSSNIWNHLKAGLMAWLFGTMQGMEITMPEKLDFKGILSVALQIVGLTYANFRKILVDKLGRGGERKVAFLEKSVEVVKILVKEGFVGIWQRALDAIDNFKSTVIDGIKNFVITSVVKGAVTWIAGLANPIGGIIKVALAIYNMIKAFLERWDQIMEIMSSIFSSISAIAKGQITEAIDFVEKSLARAIPVLFAFVAAVIPIDGIVQSIRGVIKKLSDPVKRAMTKLVEFLVKKAKKLFSKILGKINRKREIAQRGFVVGKRPHNLVPKPAGNGFVLMIASEEEPANQSQAKLKTEAKKAKEFGDDSACAADFAKAYQGEIDQAESALKKVNRDQQQKPTKGPADKADKETADAADKLTKLGPCLAENPFFDTEPKDDAMIRAREPRIAEIEGKAGLHKERKNAKAKAIEAIVAKAKLGDYGRLRLSSYYENDHIPEESLAKRVQAYIKGDLQAAVDAGERDGKPIPVPLLGDIDSRPIEDGEQLPVITVYRPLHRQKTKKTKRDHKGLIAAANAKPTPLAKIAALRAGVQKDMAKALENITAEYNADKIATNEIRGNLRAGMSELGMLNKALFGFDPGKAPDVVPAGKEAAEQVDLPMEGGPNGSGMPKFTELEGAKVAHKKRPENVSNYLEYDHVVEASIANKARDLTLRETFGGLEEPIKARSAQQAAADAKADADKGRTAELIEKRARDRMRSLKGAACTGTIQQYDPAMAGTVALYRPVHFFVSAKLQGIKGPILEPGDLTPARTRLVDYLVSDPPDMALREAAIAEVTSAVRLKFETAIADHVNLINQAYAVELKDVVKLNPSKQAAAKMNAIIEKVGTSLRELRTESLDLLK
jgi:hypothetical protein